ncbi:ABC-type Fe3+-hydroxamate transport system, substrate-binding protein [Aquimarina spongiae]|uniref:ABC-type Fe3+-hydroxamate transport system, substrate-binding protein n=2 Tax=Aquimarina spongiae TaxID=570521 RepID=A0A1M6KBU6_9FLAO|nr:helical backbone metal receptor [Aquimarina spongiae]SHJ56438.1 ABC-type Fe3+-hydroxamate transport system, substrate-binding protein [Aquimarina spongiae]
MFFIDQLDRKVEISGSPRRIVSLVPSQTELLIALGLEEHIVGVTKFCVHPDTIRKEKTIVGGTKNIKYDRIRALEPDIILCNKEENTKEIVENLAKEFPVHVSDIFTIADALELIQQYGELFDVQEQANSLVQDIEKEQQAFLDFVKDKPARRVVYFIWKDPWMAAANQTFINHLLKLNKFINVFEDEDRYPEKSKEEIQDLEKLDKILLSSEPFPFSEKHIEQVQQLHENAEVLLVDGEYFSWYGSRLLGAFTYFKTLH